MVYFDKYRLCADTFDELHRVIAKLEIPSDWFCPHPTMAHYVHTLSSGRTIYTDKLFVMMKKREAKIVDQWEITDRFLMMNKTIVYE